MEAAEGFKIESRWFWIPRGEGLDDHIGVWHQFRKNRFALVLFQIQSDAEFVGIAVKERDAIFRSGDVFSV